MLLKTNKDDEVMNTKPYQKHIPISFVYNIKYSNETYKQPVNNFGLYSPKVFY